MKRIRLFFLMVGFCCGAAAQSNLDSLYAVWKDPQRPDTVRTEAYVAYIWNGYLFSQPDTAYLLAEALITFAKAHDLPKAEAGAYRLQGNTRLLQGNYANALSYFAEGLAIDEGLGYKKGISYGLGSIGNIHYAQGNYPKALNHYQRSLKLSEELDDKKNAAKQRGNIGNIYVDQGNVGKALEYYQSSLALLKELGDRAGETAVLMNIGGVYTHLKDGDRALDHFQQALAICEVSGDKYNAANTLLNIGKLYLNNGDAIKALDFLRRGLALHAETGNKKGMSAALNQIGVAHDKQGHRAEALENCDRALELAQAVGAFSEQKSACQCLYDTYKAMGKGTEALRYLEQLRVIDDSLQAEETTKKLEQMEFAREMFADSVAQADKDRVTEAAHQEEIGRRNRTRNYLALSGIGLLVVALGFYSRSRYMRRSRDIISKERDRSENLLLNILPAEIAAELKEKGRADARDFEMVSILFTDFKGFTEASAKLSAQELVSEINTCFEAFDGIVGRHGIEKIKTIGDAYMAAGGLPVPSPGSTKNTVLAALEMQAFIKQRKAANETESRPAFEMRVGIHTGPVVAGIVGVKKFAYDIWGDTVNIASRMESSGEVGQVNISEATYALVKDVPGLMFTPRGKVQAKGKGEMEMFFVQRT